MPDKDLRKQALKGGKTVSRKSEARAAQSTQSTPPASRSASARVSRAASRVASRDVSDDEGDFGNLSDETTQSTHSIDAILESEDANELGSVDVLQGELAILIEQIKEWKGSNNQTRETRLQRYNRLLRSHHFGDVLSRQVDDVLAALSRSIKTEASSHETVLALQAVALTCISSKTETAYETMAQLLKRTISDSQDNAAKAAAIYCLEICLSFGGAGNGEIQDNCTFLLEIVQSDGSFVGADDNAAVVKAACQAYAYLTTEIEDVEAESEDAVEAFMEQLDSGDADVQVAAGEAIALLFEKSYTPREDDDPLSDEGAEDDEDSDDSDKGDKSLVKRYNAYHDPNEVIEKVKDLASISGKSVNKRDRRKIHQSFASILLTVENPRAGLRSNTSSRMVIRVGHEGEMKVDKWWKLIRLNALRRLLGGGFLNHYFEGNSVVLHSLPVLIRNPSGTMSPRRNQARKGDKFRDQRRFLSVEE